MIPIECATRHIHYLVCFSFQAFSRCSFGTREKKYSKSWPVRNICSTELPDSSTAALKSFLASHGFPLFKKSAHHLFQCHEKKSAASSPLASPLSTVAKDFTPITLLVGPSARIPLTVSKTLASSSSPCSMKYANL